MRPTITKDPLSVRVRRSAPRSFPLVRKMEWLGGKNVRTWLSDGSIRDVRMPIVANNARIVDDGVGVDPGDGKEACGCYVLSHVYNVVRGPDLGRGMIAAHEARFAKHTARMAR